MYVRTPVRKLYYGSDTSLLHGTRDSRPAVVTCTHYKAIFSESSQLYWSDVERCTAPVSVEVISETASVMNRKGMQL